MNKLFQIGDRVKHITNPHFIGIITEINETTIGSARVDFFTVKLDSPVYEYPGLFHKEISFF